MALALNPASRNDPRPAFLRRNPHESKSVQHAEVRYPFWQDAQSVDRQHPWLALTIHLSLTPFLRLRIRMRTSSR
jgi:hypothetical protein